MNVISVSMSGLLATVTLSVSLLFFYRLFKGQQYKSIQKLFCITSVICLFGCTGNGIADFLHLLLSYMNHEHVESDHNLVLRAVSDVFLYMSQIASYTALISKLHFTFRESIFRISKCTIAILSISISLQALCMIGYLSLGILFQLVKELSFSTIFEYEKPFVTIMMINDLILNALCLSLFTFKLRNLIIMTTQIKIDKHSYESLLEMDINFEANQKRLLRVMTKQLVLAVIMIIVVQIWYIEYAVVCFIITTENLLIVYYC